MAGAGAGAGSGAEPPRERRAPLGKEREAAEAEEPRQSQELLGAGSSGGSREDGVFREPEPGFAELERRLSDFSLTSAVLQQVLRGFKETLQRELGSDTAVCRRIPQSTWSPGPVVLQGVCMSLRVSNPRWNCLDSPSAHQETHAVWRPGFPQRAPGDARGPAAWTPPACTRRRTRSGGLDSPSVHRETHAVRRPGLPQRAPGDARGPAAWIPPACTGRRTRSGGLDSPSVHRETHAVWQHAGYKHTHTAQPQLCGRRPAVWAHFFVTVRGVS
ncbi:uncharacterized protein LOC142070329 isoform X1 [Caretta caretta]|uniref:uncharacterized protein LOC142070329 isoform X1 n=1 Tax=Caretta caretta TaxID=8467 RepID=UPI003F4B172E